MLVFAGPLDRYDLKLVSQQIAAMIDHYTAVPIIFSGLFGVG